MNQNTLFKTFVFFKGCLWKNNRCRSKTKPTFPHKFSLMLLLLPQPMKIIYISYSLARKENDHAFYL